VQTQLGTPAEIVITEEPARDLEGALDVCGRAFSPEGRGWSRLKE
jgi:hypothetical protein